VPRDERLVTIDVEPQGRLMPWEAAAIRQA
jgi:hypothetical protein